MKKWWHYAVLVVMMVLSACSSLENRTKAGGEGAASISSQLHREGRFSVLVYDKSEERNTDSVQGGFDWQSTGQHVVLDLSNPLGQVLARIEVRSGFSRLTRANGEVFEAEHPDMLIQEVIGRVFPVSGLQYWIHGKPMPDLTLEAAEYDGQHRLTKFTQAGWTVTAQNYDAEGPKRFQLVNQQAVERITIRIVME